MTTNHDTQERVGAKNLRPRLPASFTAPRVTTYRAEELERKELIINAGTDDPFDTSFDDEDYGDDDL